MKKSREKSEDKSFQEQLYKEGKRRFGSICEHKQVVNGHCCQCLRKVITKDDIQ